MAEFGAHLTSVAVGEEDLPSIFEVLAQEGLVSTLRPALKHALRVLAENRPHRYGWLYRYCDEVYAGLQLIVENYYLRNYKATFSENFYGLKRVPVAKASDVERRPDDLLAGSASSPKTNVDNLKMAASGLPKSEHLKSLLFVILVPYCKSKLDRFYEILSEDIDNHRRSQGVRGTFYRAFLAVYPLIHSSWEASILVFQLAYIFGKSRNHSPLLCLAGVVLQNLTADDIRAHSFHTATPTIRDLLAGKSWWSQLLVLFAKAFGLLSLVLSNGLSIGIFFLQFLDWWYASDRRATSLMALPTPHRPKQLPNRNVPRLTTVCPLCNRQRTNDTALAVTGYVFCYPCIYRYVEDHGCCPITGYPVKPDHLVKLFLSDT